MVTRPARVASHVMAAVGLSSLAATGQIHTPWLVLGTVAVVVSAALDATRMNPMIRLPWANALIVAALGFAVVDYLWLSPALLHVGAHLLITLMLTRLRHRNARELLQLVVIVFLQMVAAAGLSAHGTLNAGFAAYLPVMVWVLVHYHLLSESEHHHVDLDEPPRGLPAWTAAAALTAVVSATVLFLFLPRMGLELLGVMPPADLRLSGFSPQVRLGAIGPVKRDPTIVMRVSGSALRAGREPLYLRGAVFDAFDGQNWLATSPVRRMLSHDGEGQFWVSRPPSSEPLIAIRTEPLDTAVLFTPERTVAVRGPFAAVLVDEDAIFNLPYPSGIRQGYDVWQRPFSRQPPPRDVRGDLRYFQADGSPRIADLAHQVASGASAADRQALAVERFLKTRYSYTLDVPGGDEHPVEAFLFDRRTGYCEHFASAMVLMLRSLGIPSRLVTGFLAQEWNDFGEYIIVRQGDAHAWVEAFLPGAGWTRFDPTPAAPAADRPWSGRVEHYLDSLRTGWDRYVLDFNLRDQHTAIERAEATWDRVDHRLRESLAAARSRVEGVSTAVWIGGWLLVLSAFILAAVLRASAWNPIRPLQHRDPPVAFYERLLRAVQRRGVSKSPATTPWEFALQQSSQSAWGEAVRRVTARYYQVRYGRRVLSSSERRELEADLAAIERAQ